MALHTTGSGGLAPEVQTWYDKQLLGVLLPKLVYMVFGQAKPMPRNAGQTVNWRRFNELAVGVTPLTEGVTPTELDGTISTVTVSPVQHGDWMKFSDLVDFTSIDPVLTEFAQRLGEQAADKLDRIVRNVLFGGTNVQYWDGTRAARVNVAAGDTLNATAIRKAVRFLQVAKANKVTKILDATTGVGTKPVNASYVGIIGPRTHYDLKSVEGFLSIEEYSQRDGALPNEVGKLDDVRFVMSDNQMVWTGAGAAAIDVYGTLILGADAYGIVMPQGIETIAKPYGYGEDPLNQRAAIGYKCYFNAVRLQEAAMIRIEHAVGA
jgi:N4-gp56 family major capsid protein